MLIFGKFQGISLSSFLNQYFFYPQSIGGKRIENFIFTFRGAIGHFKFMDFSLLAGRLGWVFWKLGILQLISKKKKENITKSLNQLSLKVENKI